MDKEKETLLEICGGIGTARSALEKSNYAIFQGALTAVFNTLGKFIGESESLEEKRKSKLLALNEFVYDTRDGIVTQVEVNLRTLEEAVSISHTYERLDLIKEVLDLSINDWYGPSKA